MAMRQINRNFISKLLIFFIILFIANKEQCFAGDTSGGIEQQKIQAIELYNRSLEPLNSGEYLKAIDLLKAASDLYNDQPLIQNNYGLALLKIGDTEEALIHLLKAICCTNPPAIAWLNLGNAYETKSQYKEAIESFEKYIFLAQNSPDLARIKAHVEMLKGELKSSSNEENAEDNYLAAVTQKVKLRWPRQKMPIKVYIDNGADVQGMKVDYATLLQKAFDDWLAAASEYLNIVYVNNANQADITTRWTNNLNEVVSLAEGGDTKYQGNGKGLNHVSITILTVNPSPSIKLSPNMINWIAHHEVGHAFGLLGHSPSINDIMYFSAPQADKVPLLSQRDKQTLNLLYSRNLGPTMLSLNDEGIEAAKKGNYQLAIKKYTEALVLEPSATIPKSNLVRAEYALAVQFAKEGKLLQSEQLFQNALAIEDTLRDENLGTLIKSYLILLHSMHRNKEAQALTKKYSSL